MFEVASCRTRTRSCSAWNCSMSVSKYPITSGFDW
jgi:hypothetical protein